MELTVAQLVASGLSNKDVAAQCWVSPRTVAFHLRNVTEVSAPENRFPPEPMVAPSSTIAVG